MHKITKDEKEIKSKIKKENEIIKHSTLKSDH